MNTASSNPAAAFYASPAARAIAAAVRATHSLSTQAGTALAMRLFLTPLARGRRARQLAVPAHWRPQRHRFESGTLVSWQRSDTNIVEIVSPLWRTWLKIGGGRVQKREHHEYQSFNLCPIPTKGVPIRTLLQRQNIHSSKHSNRFNP